MQAIQKTITIKAVES